MIVAAVIIIEIEVEIEIEIEVVVVVVVVASSSRRRRTNRLQKIFQGSRKGPSHKKHIRTHKK